MSEQIFEPTLAGNTGTVFSKKARAAIKAREAKFKADLAKWDKTKDVELVLLETVAGVFQGHPREKAFSGMEGDVFTVKDIDAKGLIKAGHAKKV